MATQKEFGVGKLEERLGQVWEIARHFGLDPTPTHFEIIPPEIMHEIGSTGLPNRFSHWTHGKVYRQLKTRYDYGLSVIYEVVINSNPAQAFLLENNSDIENTAVMAHVLGHTDFFKHNYQFKKTRQDMPNAAAVSAARIRNYEFKYGRESVERFLDAALSIAEHVDPFQVTRLPKGDQLAKWKAEYEAGQKPSAGMGEFDDLFENSAKGQAGQKTEPQPIPIPYQPEKDIIGFIADFAPYLEDWQRDVLQIVRMESMYFHPQGRTKIMNEGWATYWLKRIMREMSDRGFLDQAEQIRWIAMHTGIIDPTSKGVNPYYFGMKLFDFIEDYHNGNLEDQERRWLEREKLPVYPEYQGDFVGSPGYRMAREVMTGDDDQSFVRNYFNKIPADRMSVYVYEKITESDRVLTVISDRGWERIRDRLVSSMDNSGDPYLVVTDADHDKNQSLYIKHLYEGQELDLEYLKRTLPHLYSLWGRPVYVETVIGASRAVFSYDGKQISQKA